MVTDHINGNKLDNRRSNLRFTTQAVNVRRIHNPKAKKYPAPQGVYWDKSRNKWKAWGCINYKQFHIGRYDTMEEAHEAYQKEMHHRGVEC
jgi:AP2 domain.